MVVLATLSLGSSAVPPLWQRVLLGLTLTGASVVLYGTLSVLLFFFRHWLQPPNRRFDAYRGQWAVVTGASYGIGAGFARECARRGMHVFLLARSAEKLEQVAAACTGCGVQARCRCFDFATATEDDWRKLQHELAALPVALLVNNVGVNVPFPTPFLDMDEAQIERIVRVNIGATNRMTRLLLPQMLQRQRGSVIFLSSGGGAVLPSPLLAVYAGTKAYMDAFAVALNGEVTGHGIVVQSLTPFFVVSEMSKMRHASWRVPSADTLAREAFQAHGRQLRAFPHWSHELFAALITRALSLRGQSRLVAHMHESVRKRALRKQRREQ
ncbi:hypothetical protein CDCA_CDCA04G1269 [Cyanidium caldarium]|uniref:Uncharacterized protein n=1 Tax=Cyanidium caldarium TaxID=2771 RepID=A0AAV9ISG5_CYACA|nr:hypothetical protein CDCA_CDCA04G1269 [Cyanidium caldarium]